MKARVPNDMVISGAHGERATLVYHSHSASGRHLFTATILELHGSEEHLSDGRFRCYDGNVLTHRVVLSKNWINGAEILDFGRRMFDWIGQHAQTPWSFSISMRHVKQIDYEFTFNDVRMAVLFALVWRGE